MVEFLFAMEIVPSQIAGVFIKREEREGKGTHSMLRIEVLLVSSPMKLGCSPRLGTGLLEGLS